MFSLEDQDPGNSRRNHGGPVDAWWFYPRNVVLKTDHGGKLILSVARLVQQGRGWDTWPTDRGVLVEVVVQDGDKHIDGSQHNQEPAWIHHQRCHSY